MQDITLIHINAPKRTNNLKHTRLKKHIESLKQQLETIQDPRADAKFRRATLRLRTLEEQNLSFIDAKEFFRYANKRIKGTDSVSALKIEGRLVSDDLEKASAFRDFFSSVFVAQTVEYESVANHDTVGDCPSLEISIEKILSKIKDLRSKVQ